MTANIRGARGARGAVGPHNRSVTVPTVDEPAPRIDSRGKGTPLLAGLAKHAGWSVLGMVATGAANLFLVGYAIRHLGAFEYGLFAVGAVITSFLSIADGALGLGVMRSAARELVASSPADRDVARADIAVSHASYTALSVAALVAATPLAVLVPHLLSASPAQSSAVFGTVLLLGGAAAVQLATATSQAISLGWREYRLTSIAAATGSLVTLAVAVGTIGRLGVVGLGVAQLAGVLTARVPVFVLVRRRAQWLPLLPARPRRAEIRRVGAFTLPILLISVGNQLVDLTDVLVISAIASASAVGLYRAGTVVPNFAAALLFRAVDTAFPALARSDDRRAQETALSTLTLATGCIAGLGFGVMMLQRDGLAALLTGGSASLTSSVLVIFAFVWLSNATQHCVGLLLIARGRQRSYIPFVCVELLANVALTVVFGRRFGPTGAAVATLVTIVLSNLLVLPLVVRRELSLNVFRLVWGKGVAAAALGLAVAAAASLVVAGLEPRVRVVAAAAVALAISAALIGAAGRTRLGRSVRTVLRVAASAH